MFSHKYVFSCKTFLSQTMVSKVLKLIYMMPEVPAWKDFTYSSSKLIGEKYRFFKRKGKFGIHWNLHLGNPPFSFFRFEKKRPKGAEEHLENNQLSIFKCFVDVFYFLIGVKPFRHRFSWKKFFNGRKCELL